MMPYLIDTNVLSELRKTNPNRKVVAFFDAHFSEELFVSDVTLGEIRFGAQLRTNFGDKEKILSWLQNFVKPYFGDRCLHADEETWVIWKTLDYEGKRARFTYPQPDLVIAALALQNGMSVVTRDVAPFQRANVTCVNPWLDTQ